MTSTGVTTLKSRSRCSFGRATYPSTKRNKGSPQPCPERVVPGALYCALHLAEAWARVKKKGAK